MFDTDVQTMLVEQLVDVVSTLEVCADNAERIDQLALLERLKCAAAAAQADIAAALIDESSDPRDYDQLGTIAGPARRRSVGAQVGLSRHESPHRGRGLTDLATALVHDLPHTMAALREGVINERRAQIIATESAALSHEDRLRLDAGLAPRLAQMGDRETQLAAQREVLRIDQEGAMARREKAHARRGVHGRRLRDGMGQITAVVSDLDFHQIMNSLDDQATRDKAQGQAAQEMLKGMPGYTTASAEKAEKSHTQLMADEFVARLTGMSAAPGVNIDLVVSAETLLGDDLDPDCQEPADIVGRGGVCGPIPAMLVRRLIGLIGTCPEGARATIRGSIRRLFSFTDTDALVAMESQRRHFEGGLADFVRRRDQRCRTPWCNGVIRHGDHIRSHAGGGATTAVNGEGLCAACNYTKEAHGWVHRPDPDGTDGLAAHTVEITTPTGHRHRSRAPGLPRVGRVEFYSPGERALLQLDDWAC